MYACVYGSMRLCVYVCMCESVKVWNCVYVCVCMYVLCYYYCYYYYY